MKSTLYLLDSMEHFICENPLCEEHDVPDDDEWENLRLEIPLKRIGLIVSKDCPKFNEFIEEYNPVYKRITRNLIYFEYKNA